MKNKPTFLLFAIALVCLSLVSCSVDKTAQGKGEYIIGFYNMENLFDTSHDEGKNDYDFLPDGNNQWTPEKYSEKLSNMAKVIKAMRDENEAFHTILGLAEIENSHVLDDLVQQEEIASAGYKAVLHEGPDARGIDVALLYRPEQFKLLESKSIPYDFNSSDIVFEKTPEEQAVFKTRDILMVRGKIEDEMFAFFVSHLPSRLGDKGADLRCRGAEIIYDSAMSIMKLYPGIKIVVMGDMNDDPIDASMTEYLHGRPTIAETGDSDLFSPFKPMLAAGYGSLEYKGVWNIFDIIMVNKSLADASAGTLKILPVETKEDVSYYGRVFNAPFLTQQSGRYAGTPFRTFSNGAFIGGYSDHYPTFIKIGR